MDRKYLDWKEDRIVDDSKIFERLSKIADKYGYTLKKGWGIGLYPKEQDRYARVDTVGGLQLRIGTTASVYTTDEAIAYQRRLREMIEFAGEWNTYIRDLDYKLKKEYEKIRGDKL